MNFTRAFSLTSLMLLGAMASCVPCLSQTTTPKSTPTPKSKTFYQPRLLLNLQDARIDESSGLGASRRYPGWLWTHNDSGDEARFFLFDSQGQTRAVVKLEGAKAIDWEDMAVAGTKNNIWVYAADIGDNEEKRKDITIYRFREPAIDTSTRNAEITVSCEAMTLKYPDGAHDAETLLAAPDGSLLIVTKSVAGSGMYLAPKPFENGGAQTLVKVGGITFNSLNFFARLATAGDISADGSRVVIRTYKQAYEWVRQPKESWQSLFARRPHAFDLPETQQGEAICYSLDGKKLFLTSEKLPAPLHEMSRTSR